jgi:hypothetical protein
VQRIWLGARTDVGVQASEPQQPQDVREDPGPNARLTRRQTLGNRKGYPNSLCASTHVVGVMARPRQLIRRMTGRE